MLVIFRVGDFIDTASPSACVCPRVFFFILTRKQEQKKVNPTLHAKHSSIGHDTVDFKLAQLSLRKGHNYADPQAHSVAGSEACGCLGGQDRGVSM